MRLPAFAAMAALIAAPAFGQSDTAVNFANEFLDACIEDSGADTRNRLIGVRCACGAGILVGQASERELEIIVPLIRARNDDEATAQVAQTLMSQGYSVEEIMEAANLMGEIGLERFAICDALSQ